MFAGNPCYQMCVEAFDYMPPGTYTPANSMLVTLGTGHYPVIAQPANLIDWVRFVVGQLLEEPQNQQTQLVERHYVPQGMRIFRWNPALPREIELDQIHETDALVAIGRAAAAMLDWHKILSDSMERMDVRRTRIPRNVMP